MKTFLCQVQDSKQIQNFFIIARRQEAGSRRQEAGGRRKEAGDRGRQEAVFLQLGQYRRAPIYPRPPVICIHNSHTPVIRPQVPPDYTALYPIQYTALTTMQ